MMQVMSLLALSLLLAGSASAMTEKWTDVLVSREGVRIERWHAPASGVGAWTFAGVFADGAAVAGMKVTGLAASRAGVVYAGDAGGGGRILMFGADGRFRGVLATVGYRPDQLCVSPDGSRLYVSCIANNKCGIYRYDLKTGAGGLFLPTGKAQHRGVKFGADGFLYTGCRSDNKVHVWDVSGAKPAAKGALLASNCTGAFDFTWPDGTTLIVPGSRSDVIDLRDGSVAPVGRPGDFENAIGACTVKEFVFAGDFHVGEIKQINTNGDGVKVVARGVGSVCSMINLTELMNGELARIDSCYRQGQKNLGRPLVYAVKASAPGTDFERMSFSNPEAVVYLKAGFSSDELRIVDYDGDGQDDIIVTCGWGDWPWAGTYFFRNPTPKGKKDPDPVFKAAKRIDPKTVPPDGLSACRDKDGGPLGPIHYTDGVERPDFWSGRDSQRGDRHLVDLDGDGVKDLIVRAGDRDMEAWQNCYDARGNWMRPQLRSFLYLCRGLGGDRFDDPRMIYLENEMPLEVYGGNSTLIDDWDGDGDIDFILFDFMDTIIYFENVGTKTKPVFTAGRFLRTPSGERLHGDLCLPRAIAHDWDHDGRKDIILVEEDSRVGWCRNTGAVKNGMPVFESPRFFRQHADELHFGALSCPYAYDWDGDGDQDLIVGNSHGQIAFIENLSGPGVEKPKWAPYRYLAEPDGKPIWPIAMHDGSIQGPCEWKWGYMTLSVADWDGDGLPDIMGNDTMGIVYWWRNVGTRQAPKMDFARRVEVEWDGEQPELAWGWMKPKLQKNPKDLLTQWRTTPVMTDWNGDGLMDLVMLDQEGYLALFERGKDASGRLIVKSPRRVFVDEKGAPLRLECTFNRGIGCGRRKFAVCDWNGDGKTDLVMNGGPNAAVMLQTAAKDGKYFFKSIGAVARRQLSTHDPQPGACDFNGDGVPDLVFGAMDGFIYYFRNLNSTNDRR